MQHELKCWPEYFMQILSGEKPFEIRNDDRDYKVGDFLLLREFVPCETCKAEGRTTVTNYHDQVCPDCGGAKGLYTGKTVTRVVNRAFRGLPGLKPGHVAMALRHELRLA